MKQFFAYFASLTRGQQRFLLALTILLLIPFSALVGVQLYNAVNLALLGNEIASRDGAWKAEAHALNAKVDPESFKSPSNQYAYLLMSKHGELLAERRVVVTVQVPLGELKPKKDSKITEDELLNHAAENIQAMGEKECALLIGTLASQCTVMSTTGRPVGTQAYEYQMQLAFAEKNAFGKTDAAKSYEFIVSRSSPGKAATRQRIYFEKSARERQRIYEDVADTCAAIRRKSGNCSVTALSIASRLDRGTPMARLSASAAYASLVTASELAAAAH
jgi:hypothetical protein